MNGENEFNTTPILEETSYNPNNRAKNEGPQGVTAPVLDDMDYVAPSAKKEGPQGVTAPVLDDMNSYTAPSAKKYGPQGVTAPVLDDDNYVPPQQNNDPLLMQFTPQQQEAFNQLSPDQQAQVIEMRRQQLAQQQITAPVLDDDNYVPHQKTASQPSEPVTAPVLDDDNYVPQQPKAQAQAEAVTAPVLDDAPPPPKYVPKYVDEDLERAKQEARKKAVAGQLVSNQKDEKESLRMMLELRRQREEEAAHKGMYITIITSVIGIIAVALFTLFASGDALSLKYKPDMANNKFMQFVSGGSLYMSIASGLFAGLLCTGIKGIKSFASLLFFLYSILVILSGIILLPQKDGHMALNILLYGGSLVGMIAVCVILSTSECVDQYFKRARG